MCLQKAEKLTQNIWEIYESPFGKNIAGTMGVRRNFCRGRVQKNLNKISVTQRFYSTSLTYLTLFKVLQ